MTTSERAPDDVRSGTHETGARVRTFRRMRGLTLSRVATDAGITESYLSQIERGRSVGSVAVLGRIAGALGLGLSDLFDDVAPAHSVLRAAERPRLDGAGVTKHLFTRRPLRHLEVMEAVLDPGASIGDASHVHGSSQELVIALEGQVVCSVDGTDHRLDTGDSIEYLSSSPHSVHNRTDERARILYVVSPPSA